MAVGVTIGTCARAQLNLFDLDADKIERVRGVAQDLQYTLEGNHAIKSPVDVLYTPLRK